MTSKLNYIFVCIRYGALLAALFFLAYFTFFNKAHAFFHPLEVELDHNEVNRTIEEMHWLSDHEGLSRKEWEILTDEKYQHDNDRDEPSHSRD